MKSFRGFLETGPWRTQTKEIEGFVYSFLLFVYSKPHHQAELKYIYRKWPIIIIHRKQKPASGVDRAVLQSHQRN